jgi:hypothetical protein
MLSAPHKVFILLPSVVVLVSAKQTGQAHEIQSSLLIIAGHLNQGPQKKTKIVQPDCIWFGLS